MYVLAGGFIMVVIILECQRITTMSFSVPSCKVSETRGAVNLVGVPKTVVMMPIQSQVGAVDHLIEEMFQILMNQYPTLSAREAGWIVEKRLFAEVGMWVRMRSGNAIGHPSV